MFQRWVLFLGLGSITMGCQHLTKQPAPSPSRDVEELKAPLTELVQNMYRWKETQAKQSDFQPKADPTAALYVGLDVAEHQKRLAELRASGFFSSVFLEQYHARAIQLHTALLEGRTEWPVGYRSPFGGAVDPWCQCQDTPDRYWEDIEIVELRQEGDSIRFLWSWGDSFTYLMRAEHTSTGMKIRYMEGLDTVHVPVSSAY